MVLHTNTLKGTQFETKKDNWHVNVDILTVLSAYIGLLLIDMLSDGCICKTRVCVI